MPTLIIGFFYTPSAPVCPPGFAAVKFCERSATSATRFPTIGSHVGAPHVGRCGGGRRNVAGKRSEVPGKEAGRKRARLFLTFSRDLRHEPNVQRSSPGSQAWGAETRRANGRAFTVRYLCFCVNALAAISGAKRMFHGDHDGTENEDGEIPFVNGVDRLELFFFNVLVFHTRAFYRSFALKNRGREAEKWRLARRFSGSVMFFF
ncbi:hypothetical protein EDD55_101151 [Varunaivibrio sulfuroxidans]|uniref:Uncharacterized protein n=1 Tax=Varunaivibrio sulfuroxidans TaxID=1773489 RepID=A0A4V2UPE0_9PROT|nr:hypothetical protein EDD55_101151 [Varunaivibrio sulfuroxidans]